MNILIFTLLVVPTVYSLGVIPDGAIKKEWNFAKPLDKQLTSVTIDVEKANKEQNHYPLEHPHIVEDFFSSSTDVDRNGQPDINQTPYVEPIIGPVPEARIPSDRGNKPLIPNQFITKVWDHKKGAVKFITIDVEKLQDQLGSTFWPYPYPYPDDGKEGVVVASNNRKKRQAILYKTPLDVEHPNYAEDYFRKSTDLNRNGQPDITEDDRKVVYPYVLPTYRVLSYPFGVGLRYPFGAGLRYWY